MVNITFRNSRNFTLLEKKLIQLFEDFLKKSGLEGEDIDITIDYEQSSYSLEFEFLEKHYKKNSYNPIHAAKEAIAAISKGLRKTAVS